MAYLAKVQLQWGPSARQRLQIMKDCARTWRLRQDAHWDDGDQQPRALSVHRSKVGELSRKLGSVHNN